jgi:hypothetical protein
LRVFNFDDETVEVRNSGKLFARRNLNAPATEKYLSKHIEDPFARMQDAIRAAAPDLDAMRAAFATLPASALVGLYWLQMQRIRDANKPRTADHLDEIAQRGPIWLDGLAAAVFHDYEPLLYGVREALFFPESAFFLVPMIGEMPVFALPIDPGLALVFARRSGDRAQLDRFMDTPGMPMACSLGLSKNARRIVLPPELLELPPATSLVRAREGVRALFGLYAEMEAAVGLVPTWAISD